MSRTETITTAYGDVDIETVECSSCGTTVPKEDAYRFIMFERGRDPSFTSRCDVKGWACEYCADSGPAAFPSDISDSRWGAMAKKLLWDETLDEPSLFAFLTGGMLLAFLFALIL